MRQGRLTEFWNRRSAASAYRELLRPAALLLIAIGVTCPVLAGPGRAAQVTAGLESSEQGTAGQVSTNQVSTRQVSTSQVTPNPDGAADLPDGRRRVMVEASNRATVLHLPVGRSLVLSTSVALRRVYVGDPKILHSFASGPKEDVITARICGVSTLILWDQAGGRQMYTVYSDFDTDGLARAIADALPDANVAVTAKSSRVYLAGTVTSDAAAEALGKLALTYSKDVVNGVRVLELHTPQVELKLRIVEIDRSKLQQYGLNFFALGGSTLAGTTTGQFSSAITAGPPLTVSDPLNLLLFSTKLNAGVTVKDLEQKQILQILAEPTLTTLSGIAARFLSGGEFPLPVVQGGTGNSTAITIVWKPYGVKVDFTPTAHADGTIRLKIAPEVSTLDYTNAVTISGFTIPALSTRRAETEIELESGQSFVLSGLLDHRTTDNLSRMPGIANVPILGQLFRSKGMTLTTVDLAVVVTATVVNPLAHAEAVVEPKMIMPSLDKQRFDDDVNGKRPGKGPAGLPAVASPAVVSPSGPPPAVALPPEAQPSRPVTDLSQPESAVPGAAPPAAEPSALSPAHPSSVVVPSVLPPSAPVQSAPVPSAPVQSAPVPAGTASESGAIPPAGKRRFREPSELSTMCVLPDAPGPSFLLKEQASPHFGLLRPGPDTLSLAGAVQP